MTRRAKQGYFFVFVPSNGCNGFCCALDRNARYIEKTQASERDRDGDNEALAKEAGPQGQLNRIIATLDFSD